MKFTINIKYGYRTYKLLVEQIPIDRVKERYRISGKSKRSKVIVLECNRPFYRNRGLKKFPPTWQIIEGEIKEGSTREDIIREILAVVDLTK